MLSFLAAGRGDLAVPALRWLAREQAPEGLWLQRYWTDGSLAPSWGLHQLDETGMAVFAYEAAWRELGDAALDRELWPSARAAADFLCGFIDEETDLPLPSVDLWEQTDGQHSYSAAATYGGLVAAAAMAARHEPRARGALPRRRRACSRGDRGAPLERRARPLSPISLGRSLGRAGETPPAAFDRRLRYPTKAVRSVDLEDARVDSSLLGLCWPFRAVDPSSPRMRATIEAVERELRLADGGVLRHEADDYAGGNPWLIRRCGSVSQSDRSATTPGIEHRSTTRSRGRRRSGFSPSRSRATASPRGSSRSAGATRCSSLQHVPSSPSFATAPD